MIHPPTKVPMRYKRRVGTSYFGPTIPVFATQRAHQRKIKTSRVVGRPTRTDWPWQAGWRRLAAGWPCVGLALKRKSAPAPRSCLRRPACRPLPAGLVPLSVRIGRTAPVRVNHKHARGWRERSRLKACRCKALFERSAPLSPPCAKALWPRETLDRVEKNLAGRGRGFPSAHYTSCQSARRPMRAEATASRSRSTARSGKAK